MPSSASLPWFTPVALAIVRQAPRCAVLSSQRTGGAELAGFPSRNVTHRRWRRAKDPPYVGSPETVAQKIAANLQALGATRFDLKYGMPGLTHDQMMAGIELYGQHVTPASANCLSNPATWLNAGPRAG
jgi:alkanesulfonate monooxygenase SsuD/methylene tetrahydromethanopterin reductase-like flavin-dependent oxidoreductase (luciferase family)